LHRSIGQGVPPQPGQVEQAAAAAGQHPERVGAGAGNGQIGLDAAGWVEHGSVNYLAHRLVDLISCHVIQEIQRPRPADFNFGKGVMSYRAARSRVASVPRPEWATSAAPPNLPRGYFILLDQSFICSYHNARSQPAPSTK
jgi:hypothetical protein